MIRLLYIEDDPKFAALMGKILSHAATKKIPPVEIEIRPCCSLVEAEALLRDHWDAVLLDLTLDDGGVDSTLAWLDRKAASLPPVIVVTGSMQHGIEPKCFRMGADGFLFKDWLMSEPINSLHHIMQCVWRKADLKTRYGPTKPD